jgi:hypothetical protein
MQILTRWFAPALLAAGLGFGAMAPAPAHAQDSLARVLVDVADVVFNGGTPYYRYGNYGPGDRLVVGRDAYGRPIYYRQVPYAYRDGNRGYYDRYDHDDGRYRSHRRHHGAPPYGNAYGYYRNGPGSDRRHGWSDEQHWRDRDDRDHDWRDRGDRDDDD